MRKQRSALVMTNIAGRKTIFFAYGTVLETGRGAAGGIIAFDVATNSVTALLPMTQGLGGGIWMGGQGLAADAAGFLYGVTGNGSFNGVTDFGETIFKASTLRLQPARVPVHWRSLAIGHLIATPAALASIRRNPLPRTPARRLRTHPNSPDSVLRANRSHLLPCPTTAA